LDSVLQSFHERRRHSSKPVRDSGATTGIDTDLTAEKISNDFVLPDPCTSPRYTVGALTNFFFTKTLFSRECKCRRIGSQRVNRE
jgi:hypothetical protein